MSASKSPADIHLDVAPTPKAQAAPAAAPPPQRPLWRSLPASSRALLVLGAGSALAAGGRLLQDLLLILLTALLTLALLLDAFKRENAYQLLACLGLGALQISQLTVFLAELQGDGEEGAAAAVAACLLLLLAAAAVARPAYLSWGWRMYSKIASAWRLKPAEQLRLRAAALARQRFAALAKLDASLLALLLVVAAVNAANPSADESSAQPVVLLIGAAAAAAPLLGGWLVACLAAVRARRPSRLAPAVELTFPLCYVPPLLILFVGATKGGQLEEPHGQAYLIVYSVLFLAARTATWWAARQLAFACLPLGTAAGQQQLLHLQQVVAAAGPGSAEGSTDESADCHLPAELLPLVRGAWLLKLPSGGGSSGSGEEGSGGDTLQPCISTTSSLGITTSGSMGVPCSSLCCLGGGGDSGWSVLRLLRRHGSSRGRQRFFQLSTDGACLRWNWHRWVLMPHVEAIHCNDQELTIRLALLLEPDLNLRFACPRHLAGHSLGGSGQLAHAESAGFSSWGLPSPSTATARTPFNTLSRFNSLAGSAQYSPQAGHRPALPFAFAGQQQQQQALQQLGGGGAHAPWAGIPPFTAAHHTRGGTAGGSGSGHSSARGDGEAWQLGALSDAAPMAAELISPMAMGILGGLGISVPVEMIAYQDLQFGKFLGEGSEGSVYAAWHHETPVAVKRTRSLMEIEMNLHAGVHDNIVGLRGLCSHGGDLYLVMELCPRGTLDVLVHRSAGSGHRLEPGKLLPIVRSIARGMVHLHSRRPAIFHRDLKPGNVFLGHGGVVKVGDMGMSRYAAQCRSQGDGGGLERTLTPGVIGTAAYAAPELLNPETPDSAAAGRQVTAEEEARILKADVYSFGVTLFEIMERRRPFAGMDGFQIQTQWYLDPQSMRLPRPGVPDGLAPQAQAIMETLADLVEQCTRWDPDERPTFQDVLAALRSATGAADAGATPAPVTLVNPL
ncbi:Mitogen-activated kinase kinase kinase dlk-1 [Chlorella sorokiniana]|uniref:Mitogen-activated kinase kinase kinase dlk-1 n=1 Tax=Chlorella sorokiniana TaxID=3076 RepID=A0A2P6TJ80_CHLSO|nr:Mitogen-activated kinase kinase kinase dlk-1 [Chlorella sorokiniana]|eukprot:PRW39298.1 Mitogen-activated kinase kinase kinase dlk-1 [Chlorella sorokiniana]